MRFEAHIRSLDNCIAAIVHYSELNGRSHPKPLQHTALPAGSGRARGRMVGSDQYLTKPFTKDSLLKTVGTHVNH